MSRCRWLCSRNWSRPGSGRTRGRAAKRRDTDAVPRVLDELFEASHFGLVAFGAHHPVRSRHSIRRSLCLEKFPGSLVLAKRSLAWRVEAPRAVFVRVDPRPCLVPFLERRPSAWVDEAQVVQVSEPFDVDIAPDAALAPGRDPLRRAVIAQRVANAVDPAEAELLVDNVLPRDRRTAGSLAVISDPEIRRRLVVDFEPRAQLGGRREELHVLGRGHVATIYTWPTSPTGRATTTRWPARASTGWPVWRTAFLPSA